MAFAPLSEIRRLLDPHYLMTVVLAVIFFPLRMVNPVCETMFPGKDCQLDYHECEVLFFLLIVILFRTRRLNSTSLVPYISAASMYSKIAMVILFFYNDIRYGVIYTIACILHLMVFPEPTYRGPDTAVYFTAQTLEEELQRDKKVVWIVEFFALWSPPCINFASDYRVISAKYKSDNLRFGKLDITRNPEAAEKYHINVSTFSKQLPTLLMFKDGKPYMRRPMVDNKNKLAKFNFNVENVVNEFDLNNLSAELSKINKTKTKPEQEGKKKK